jgi:hypothetical protein
METEQHICVDQWVIKVIREEIKKFLEFNKNEITTYQNPWNTAKAVLWGKFIAMSAYIKNTENILNKLPNAATQTHFIEIKKLIIEFIWGGNPR